MSGGPVPTGAEHVPPRDGVVGSRDEVKVPPAPGAGGEERDETVPVDPAVRKTGRRRSRRRPAPRAHPFFRYVYPAFVVAAAVVVVVLASQGSRAVLDSREGRDVPIVSDPDAPGFLAFVEPTPTMLVAHVDDTDALVGVTVLARTALQEGGSLVVLSADLLIDLPGDDVILEQVYAAEGTEGLERVVGEFFGFGFTDDPMVLDPESLAVWLAPVEPIPFRLSDDLVEDAQDGDGDIVHERGAREFSAVDLAAIYGWRNPAEVDAGRFTRQEAIWEAWLRQIRVADDAAAATLPFDDLLSPYLLALGTGTGDVDLAPMSPVGFDPENPIYVLAPNDPDWPRRKALEMVPLPVAPQTGARPTVRVLDGTGDTANRDAMLPVLVAAGAEVSVIGNAPAFGVEETRVEYHLPEHEEMASEFAASIGTAVAFDDDPNQPVELTVTIGTDRQAPDGG